MRSRGYSISSYESLKTAYHNKPTALQQASYDVHLIGLVKNGDVAALRCCLAAGLSQNPSNNWGESLVHMVCRLGDPDLLRVLIQNNNNNNAAGGCCNVLQVADDYGRTPLHDACWSATPCFESIEMILDQDVNLLHMRDCRGALPLAYVQKEHWADWISFLQSKKEKYFPEVPRCDDLHKSSPHLLTQQLPNSRPVPDPPNALALDLARMVASGRITPAEVAILLEDDDDDDDDYEDDNSSICSEEEGSFPPHDDVDVSFGRHTYSFSNSDDDGDQSEESESNSALDFLLGTTDFDDDYSDRSEVGILGISSPQYGEMSFVAAVAVPSSAPAAAETVVDMAPVTTVLVDERVTEEFFLQQPLRDGSIISTVSKQDPKRCHLPQENDGDGLLAFSC